MRDPVRSAALRRLPALILILGCLAARAGAGEAIVTATVPWIDRDGYTPVIVHLESALRPLDVALDATLGSAAASDTVAVRPGAPATRTILVPSSVGWGASRLTWNAGGERGDAALSPLSEHRALDLALLDPNEELRLPELNKLIGDGVSSGGQVRGGWSSRSGERVKRFGADALPDRWQGWPAWLTLAATPAGEAALTPAQREAIAIWTRCGGALFVTTQASVEAWGRLGARAVRLDPADGEQRELIARLRAAADETGNPTAHPVPGTAQLPVAWFVGLAITFAALAGPLNLWWARRRGSPHLLLITTPLLSLGACVLLVVVALASDGIGRRRSAVQVAVLDCPAQQAVTFTGITYFCGISPGRFACDPEDRILPMDESDFRTHSAHDTSDLRLAWAGTPSAEGSWIPARVNRQLAWTQPRPERRRVVAHRVGGGWRIANGLGVGIATLRWTDPQGAVWETGSIAAGAEAQATRVAEPHDPGNGPGNALPRLGPDARLAVAAVAGHPGTFSAWLSAPLQAAPGPEASDAETMTAWAVGHAQVDGDASGGGF